MGYCEKCEQDIDGQIVEVARVTPMGSWVHTFCEPCMDVLNDEYTERAYNA